MYYSKLYEIGDNEMTVCTKQPKRLPSWFKQTGGKLKAVRKLSDQLEGDVPHSICEEARCPNRSECFSKGVLTYTKNN